MKKIKMIKIIKIIKTTPVLPSRSMGGHMPHPPVNCNKIEFFQLNPFDNIVYLDESICSICKDVCQRRIEFKQEWKNYRSWLKTQE